MAYRGGHFYVLSKFQQYYKLSKLIKIMKFIITSIVKHKNGSPPDLTLNKSKTVKLL